MTKYWHIHLKTCDFTVLLNTLNSPPYLLLTDGNKPVWTLNVKQIGREKSLHSLSLISSRSLIIKLLLKFLGSGMDDSETCWSPQRWLRISIMALHKSTLWGQQAKLMPCKVWHGCPSRQKKRAEERGLRICILQQNRWSARHPYAWGGLSPWPLIWCRDLGLNGREQDPSEPWCQGFTLGLGKVGEPRDSCLPGVCEEMSLCSATPAW